MANEHRYVTLLRAAKELLEKQKDNRYVLDLLEETVVYDGAICTGDCLLNDIIDYLEEVDHGC